MASFRKRGSTWRAEVRKGGIYESATFPSKLLAERWATQLEADIGAGKRGSTPRKTLGELLQRYAEEVSSTKRSERWERNRIAFICTDPLSQILIADLSSQDMAAWRDRRVRATSPATVRREMTLLNHAINISIKEWGWLTSNPMSQIRKPSDSQARDRRITDTELEAICHVAGYHRDQIPGTMTSRVAAALLFAIESAMRVGEIVKLTWDRVDIKARVAHLDMTKNGFSRDVPLSREAIRLLEQLPRVEGDPRVFLLSATASVDAIFRKIKTKAGIEDLHFHDSRHEAITRLSRKLDVLALARMTGHRNIKELMTYYNESASEIAARLN